MTCIVGIADGRNVWMGGDAAASSGSYTEVRAHAKVFGKERLGKDGLLIGYTSSFRMGQSLQYGWSAPDIPSRGSSLMAWMCTDFIESVRDRLGESGFKKSENGVDTGGVFMVGVRGRLFTVNDDFQVGEVQDEYNAVGCGADIARGAMFAIGSVAANIEPARRIEIALSAAARWSSWVSPPFTIETLREAD